MRELTSSGPTSPSFISSSHSPHTADSNVAPPSTGSVAGTTGRVSITTRSGVSSRSREVHVTLPPAGRDSPPSPALPGAQASGLVGAALPPTPIAEIDHLYYDDPRKLHPSTAGTGDDNGPGARRRSARGRRRKTASSVGGASMSGGEDYGTEYTYDDDELEEYAIDDDPSERWAGGRGGVDSKDGPKQPGDDTKDLGALEAGSPLHGHGRMMSGAFRAGKSPNASGKKGSAGAYRHSHHSTANSNGGLSLSLALSDNGLDGASSYLGSGLPPHHHLGDSVLPVPEEGDSIAEEEDSPYPEVRASVSNVDDPSMPVLTLRMWVLGITLSLVGAGGNTYFTFRYPSPTITALLLLLIAHPLGKMAAYTLPIETYMIKIPGKRWARTLWGWMTLKEWRRRRNGGKVDDVEEEEDAVARGAGGNWWEWELDLNPGPFNIKVRRTTAI